MKTNKFLDTILSDEDKKEETDYDEGNKTDPNGTVAFNAIVDLKDTSLHATNISVNDECIYSDEKDEEVSFDELEEKYNLMYMISLLSPS